MNEKTRGVFAGPATWRPFPVITSGCLWAMTLIGAHYACHQRPPLDIGAQIALMAILVVLWIWLDRQRADRTLRWTFLGIVACGAIVAYCVNGEWWALCYDLLIVATSWKYLVPDNDQTRAVSVHASGLVGLVEYDSMRFAGVLVEEYSSDWTHQLSDTRTDADGNFVLPRASDVSVHHIKVSWPGTRTVYLTVEIISDAQPLVIHLKHGKPKRAGNWGEWAA